MAIDTAQKQVSMLNWHSGRSLPLPNGAYDQSDMQTLLDRYGGVLWATVTSATGVNVDSMWYLWENFNYDI